MEVEFSQLFGIEMDNGVFAEDCLRDSLSFYLRGYRLTDGSMIQLSLYAKVCGAFPPSKTVIPHNDIVVVFESNNFNNYAGFQFKWRAVEANESREVAEVKEEDIMESITGTSLAQGRISIPGFDESNIIEEGEIIEEDDRATAPNPCSRYGVLMKARSAMISTPSPMPSSGTCAWTIAPRLAEGTTQKQVDIRFYDFVVDPNHDCSESVLEISYRNAKGKLLTGRYSCGSKMPPFEEAEFARTTTPVKITFFPGNHRFDIGYIIITSKSGSSPSEPSQPSVPAQPSPQSPPSQPSYPSQPSQPSQPSYPTPPQPQASFQLTQNCGRSSVSPPAVSFTGSMRGDFSPSPHGRIVGGKPAKPGSWPWAAELAFRGTHMCGATILNEC